jgi:acyl-CoA thioesterase FadM
MSDVGIEFKNELFYGDTIKASVTATEFSRVSFEVYYKLEKSGQDGKMIPVVFAKTGIVCFDYTTKKIVPVPNEVKMKLTV